MKVPFKYKKNVITGELHRAKRIASDFDEETKRIRSKYIDAGYPKHVFENTIKNFNKKKDELIISPWLFGERKHVAIRLPLSSKNKKYTNYRSLSLMARLSSMLFGIYVKFSHYSH